MAAQLANLTAGGGLPEPHYRFVPSAPSQHRAIWRKRQSVDRVAVAQKAPDFFATCYVAQVNSPFFTRPRNRFSIWREGDSTRGMLPWKSVMQLAGFYFPEDRPAFPMRGSQEF